MGAVPPSLAGELWFVADELFSKRLLLQRSRLARLRRQGAPSCDGSSQHNSAPKERRCLTTAFRSSITYATSSSPLTRPRSSGTLSREGRGLWLDARIGIESSNPLPSRERVVRSRRFHQPGRAG